MSGAPGRPVVPRRYVNDAEKASQTLARQLGFEEALEAAKEPEGPPRPATCVTEPLWRVCVADCDAAGLAQCARTVLRDRAIFEARMQVLASRAGL